MKNKILTEIKEFAIKRLNEEYGYCGVAESDTFVMISSDDKNGGDIIIKLKLEE